jgi:hypothetical protein
MDILFKENYIFRSSIAKLEEAGHKLEEGEEESTASTSMMMQTNKGCLRCLEAASEAI